MSSNPDSPEASLSPPDSPQMEDSQQAASTQKRTATDAGLKPNGIRPAKSVKRRASKACQCCRSRKVRCNVVEHGAPCTNCRLDEVECIVTESKRKKKWNNGPELPASSQTNKTTTHKPAVNFPMSAVPPYEPLKKKSEHVPHTLCTFQHWSLPSVSPEDGPNDAADQDLGRDLDFCTDPNSTIFKPNMLLNLQRMGQKAEPNPLLRRLMSPSTPSISLPAYIKPLPPRFGHDELAFLEKKGALTIPPTSLRNALLRNFVEFVYPYMPMVNLHELVESIDRNDGSRQTSLLLFQAIMFTGIATVEMRFLKAAGYDNRRDARREFFQKTRLLYDFDCEVDRIALIQSLLLMTYWYETPDDQKDSHHWMGIAVSLSQTIGLHRDPEHSNTMDAPRKRLWRRIWWSTYMRDRLIALGMRRPTRIKNSDFDVPMLSLEDFELHTLADGPSCIPRDCKFLHDFNTQRTLAVLCMAKAKLCVAMSHVLSVQYSVLHNNHGTRSVEGDTRPTMMLVRKKFEPELFNDVQECDAELQDWKANLAEEAQYVAPTWDDIDSGSESVILNRSLLHMIYFATLSALHRPQVLPSTAMAARASTSDMIDTSRKAVRLAASEITHIATTLYSLDMVPKLPTSGVTVLLPAIIIHLLDIKAPDDDTRRASLKGFCECMQIMAKLRDIYAAADYSTAFLEAAIRKAEITLPQKPDEVKDARNVITSSQGLVEAGRRMALVGNRSTCHSGALTPPPDDPSKTTSFIHPLDFHSDSSAENLTDEEVGRRLHAYLASTPPNSDHSHQDDSIDTGTSGTGFDLTDTELDEPDFDSLINLDAAGEVWNLDDTAYGAMQGESSGFTMDMDFYNGLKDMKEQQPIFMTDGLVISH